jgi:hypothetical protein
MCWLRTSGGRSTHVRMLLYLSILTLMPVSAVAFTTDRAHVIIAAIDDSGSMKQSDPQNIRLEAAAMLTFSSSPSDQFGIMRFGNEAAWVQTPSTAGNSATHNPNFAQFRSSDSHTNFAAPLSLILRYVEEHGDLLKNYDVSVVLLTDGNPDPDTAYPGGGEGNERDSQNLAASLSQHGVHLFTIGLGDKLDSKFLRQLAGATDGSYSPARTSAELGDAFLRAVTRILALPAYAKVSGPALTNIHVGPKSQLTRAYLFRQSQASVLAGRSPGFESEHVAVYDLPLEDDVSLQIVGSTSGASAIVCVRQPLSFSEEQALPPTILVDLQKSVAVRLQGGGERQWGRLFMQDAGVELRLETSGEPDIREPLYAYPEGKDHRGFLRASRSGDFKVYVHLESPYAQVDHFLGNLSVYANAVTIPKQVQLIYPSFFPGFARHLFAVTVPIRYDLATGVARVTFQPTPGLSTNYSSVEVAPGQPRSVSIWPESDHDGGILTILYDVEWKDDEQTPSRPGILSIQMVPEGPIAFTVRHWLTLAAAGVLIVLAWLLQRTPKLKGILVIEQAGTGKRRIVLAALAAKSVTISETSGDESLTSVPIRVRGDSNHELFTLRMVKTSGRWSPKAYGQVPLICPSILEHGSQIILKDHPVTFTYYNG